VSYAAVIDVDNTQGRLMPGGTTIIVIDGTRRENAIRIPNNALTFRPSPAALEAVGQGPPVTGAEGRSVGPGASKTPRPVYVWKFEDRTFVPMAIETGLSDERWTELVRGSLRPGDVLVTAATPKADIAANPR
jgi:HlyD family secretion protein